MKIDTVMPIFTAKVHRPVDLATLFKMGIFVKTLNDCFTKNKTENSDYVFLKKIGE